MLQRLLDVVICLIVVLQVEICIAALIQKASDVFTLSAGNVKTSGENADSLVVFPYMVQCERKVSICLLKRIVEANCCFIPFNGSIPPGIRPTGESKPFFYQLGGG